MQNLDELRCAIDPEKMHAYNSFLEQNAQGKVVCDIGCGPGVLTYLALIHGAKKVYAIEHNIDTLEAAKKILSKYADKIVFIHAEAYSFDYPDDIDLVIHEVLGNAVYDENILPIFRQLKKHNLLEKTYPTRFEFFQYRWMKTSQLLMAYNYTNFDDNTAEYHRLAEEAYPNCLTQANRTLQSYIIRTYYHERYNFLIKNHTIEPEEEWDKINYKWFNNLKPEEYVGWRAYLTDSIYFSNTPRPFNNWQVIDRHLDLTRLYNATTDTSETI